MKQLAVLFTLFVSCLSTHLFAEFQEDRDTLASDSTETKLIVVVGAGGTDEYNEQFLAWAENWKTAADQAGNIGLTIVGNKPANQQTSYESLKTEIAKLSNESKLWIVLIGHGTFDGQKARFNLQGPDVSASELKQWLEPIEAQQIIVNCASSSAPFINELSGKNRIIVTATKSGYEYNFARFGQYLSTAIADPANDLDKDSQISLLEAALAASNQVNEFYETENRLVTEHALIDDNHDGVGTPTEWFRGVRVVKQAKTGEQPDGTRANQVFLLSASAQNSLTAEQNELRNQLELELERLRSKKSLMTEEDYYVALEKIALQLSNLYDEQ